MSTTSNSLEFTKNKLSWSHNASHLIRKAQQETQTGHCATVWYANFTAENRKHLSWAVKLLMLDNVFLKLAQEQI